MATEKEKTEKMMEIEGLTIYGLAMGMWELFGESSFAATKIIGDLLLARMETNSGLEIQGESPENILAELVRLFTDEVGMFESGNAILEGDRILLSCKNCLGAEGCSEVQGKGVQPFYCPVYSIVTAALRTRQGKQSRFISRKWDESKQACILEIQVMQ